MTHTPENDAPHQCCWHTTDEGEWCCICEGITRVIPPGNDQRLVAPMSEQSAPQATGLQVDDGPGGAGQSTNPRPSHLNSPPAGGSDD